MTRDEIDAGVASGPDEAGMVMDRDNATIEMPQPKAVLDHFRETGRGYQTRVNAVLKSYVSRMRHDQH